ncbi:unnamed protein product [Prorocentrum cordatum]|uniref:Uncharacterized protein n=1 Tax=Prorocentrum cordatum TaxID=2364126 RepID=A0ABN9VJH3_9DINO|nr:unnamed protein product [Polarella glacialis]
MGAELDELTENRRDWREQEMILEQWVAEVESARAAFFLPDMRSPSDAEFVSKLSVRNLSRLGELSPTPTAYPRPPAGSAASYDSDFVPAGPGPPESQQTPCPVGTLGSVPVSSVGSFVPHPGLRASPLHAVRAGRSGGGSQAPPEPPLPDPELTPRPPSAAASGDDPLQDSFVPHPALSVPDHTLQSDADCGAHLLQDVGQGPPVDSFVPHPGLAVPSCTFPLPEGGPAEDPHGPPPWLSPGARVQVWSDTHLTWLDAVVGEAFSSPTHRDGFLVPAGTVKVVSASGVKWVLPERAPQLLRQPPPSGLHGAAASSCSSAGPRPVVPRFSAGDAVQVWSESRRAWLSGVVREAFALPSRRDGYFIPAGTLKVTSAAGEKWILPEHVAEALIPAASAPPSPSAGSAHGAAPPAASSGAPFARGDRLQVWSESRRAWLDATVLEAFAAESTVDGFAVPAGALKVRSAAGDKWVMPADAGRLLRQATASAGAAAGATRSLDSRLELVLRDPRELERSPLGGRRYNCPGGEGLPRDRVSWALEGLARQFDVRLDLEGDHVAAIWSRMDAMGVEGADYVSKAQFCDLSRALIAELHSSMAR